MVEWFFVFKEVDVSCRLLVMSEYSNVCKGPLRFKTDGIKKKKKKDKDMNKILDQVAKVDTSTEEPDCVTNKSKHRPQLTKAQHSFLKMKEKKQDERILDKASRTHKQRVEEFNRHLDSLTEHYDIPKVSWTK